MTAGGRPRLPPRAPQAIGSSAEANWANSFGAPIGRVPPLGPRSEWPQSLRTVLNVVVESRFPNALLWGPDLLLLYNDAYRVIAGDKHPAALGRSTRVIWSEVWHINEPIFAAVMQQGESRYFEDKLFPINRRGRVEDAYFTLCYSPVRVEDGAIGGTLVTLQETTDTIGREARLRDNERRLQAAIETAVETFRASEERYRTLFGTLIEGFCIIEVIFDSEARPVDYRFLEINPAFEAQTGLQNVRGRLVRELVPDNEARWYDIYGDVALTGRPTRFVDEAKALNRWFDVSAYRVGGPESRKVAILFNDITESKRAEQEQRRLLADVQAQKDRLAALVNSMRDEVWFCDAEKRFTLQNPAAAREFGLGAHASVDVEKFAASLEVLDPDGRPRSVEDAPPLRALKGEAVVDREEIIRTPATGELRHRQVSAAPVRDASGTIIGSVSVVRDITERKRAEARVVQSQKTFEELVDRAPFGIYVIDSRFRIAHMNAASQVGAFQHVRPVIGRDFSEAMHVLWPDSVAEGIIAEFRHTLETGESYYSPRFVNPRHDVEAVEGYEWELHQITLPDGQRGVICYYFDSTSLREAEEALRQLNRTLEQRVAERTAEVRQAALQLRALASELAQTEQRERTRLSKILHDHVQQLLVAARMQVERLTRDADPARRLAAAETVDGILKDALDASRSLTVELSPPVLHEAGLIGGLNWLASRMLEKNQFTVRLRTEKHAEPATEETRGLLFDCARELLLNAMKHAGVSEAQLTLLRTGDGRVRLIVHDEGKGIDPVRLGNRRADDVSFGLFSIQQRVAHLGGEMEIATAPGKGTTIIVTVSGAVAGPHPEATAEPAREGEQVGRTIVRAKTSACRVLIVDDHKIVREGLVELMRFEADIDVVGQAADGPAAIELAGKLEPDVIIMDVNLGEMSGIEATRTILARNPNIKVIGLSMHTDHDVALALSDAGAVGFVSKGGPTADLLAAIRAAHR